MIIVGLDYYLGNQYIAFLDTETGKCGERRLNQVVNCKRRPEVIPPSESPNGAVTDDHLWI